MSRKQSPTRKEAHRTNESRSKERTAALKAARRDKSAVQYRFGTENVK